MKGVDLRSDTITQPTDAMRRAMCEAEVGDDVYGEDPTVNRLEDVAAAMLGKEAGLFTASGTMSNLIALLVHTRPGDEIVLGSEAHILWYEVGSASAVAGTNLRAVPNDEYGRMDVDLVQAAIRPEDIHFPSTSLLCIENTHNRCGGAVLTPAYTAAACDVAHRNGLQVHLDGARIFNAAVALDIPAVDLTAPVDSVCFCLSKSLSAPVGSVLCGSRDFIARARKKRKMLGGGMRQAGIIAAAGLVALDTMLDQLEKDHGNAKRLAIGLAGIPGVVCSPEATASNIVMFSIPPHVPSREFVDRLRERGVKLNHTSRNAIRAVTHRMIDADDVDYAIDCVRSVLNDLG